MKCFSALIKYCKYYLSLLKPSMDVQVQFAQRRKGPENVQPPLYMAKCTELANYYFGFNGWTTRIVQVLDK